MAKAPTDFNDLHVLAGLDEVRRQLLAALDSAPLFDEVAIATDESHLPATEALREPDTSEGARSDSSGGEHNQIFEEWYQRLSRTEKGKILPVIHNITAIMSNDGRWKDVLAYCEFSHRVLKRHLPPYAQCDLGEWSDADTARTRIWLGQHFGISPKASDVDDAVMVMATANKFHPVRDYLRSLKWDFQPRLDTWLWKYLGAQAIEGDEMAKMHEERYIALAGRFWMIGAVARVMCPPVKMDNVLILEGLQGLGKSTALKILGGDWFSDTHFALGDKDGYQQMQGVWIYELAELDALNKAEATRIKQFLGAREDRFRPSYGRRAQTFVRQCVFAGTTNPTGAYLKDATGNRRFWPVMCTAADFEALQRDRDQLWAEAVVQFDAGVRWWPDETQVDAFREEQEKRFDADAWESIIEEWLLDVQRKFESHTIAEVMQGALRMDVHQIKPPEQKRVAAILSRLGWEQYRPKGANGSRTRKFRAPEGWGK